MTAGDDPAHPPFMTLIHGLDDFVVLERESGDSILGFLGALAGMQEDMKLTSQRIQNLHGLDGSLRFSLTGENAFSLTAHFGESPVPESPSCSITVDGAAYQELRSGALPPQDAFLSGKIQVEGDMQMAMQLALAALSPE
jgi:putative sterol carrier protein